MDGIEMNTVKAATILEGIEAIRIPEYPYTIRCL